MARSHGVLIEAGDVFFAKPPYPCPFFRLRLSSIAAAQIPAGIRALGLAVEELAQARGEARVRRRGRTEARGRPLGRCGYSARRLYSLRFMAR